MIAVAAPSSLLFHQDAINAAVTATSTNK